MGYGQYSSHSKPVKPSVPASKEKTKRLKHVFDDPSHVWAHPLQKDGSGFEQASARNPQHNFYFETHEDATRVLYSYRDSYPIASLFIQKKKPVYLLRSGKPFSVTTARHFHRARMAVQNTANVFNVPYVTRYTTPNQQNADTGKPDKATHAANVADYAERITLLVGLFARVKSSWSIESTHADITKLLQEVKAYCKLFGLKLPKLPKLPTLDASRIDKAKAREEHTRTHRAEIDAKREEARIARAKEQIAAWKRGETSTGLYGYGYPYAFLRVRRNPETGLHDVQTSQGVSVPVLGATGAARLLRFLQALKAEGRTYQRNGHTEHIGQFTVESFKPAVATASANNPAEPEWILTAGCHRIKWEEVQSVAEAIFKAEEKDKLHGIAFA